VWIAGGDTFGTISISSDAVNWTTRESGFKNGKVQSVAYGDGLWTIVSSAEPVNKIRTSTDNGVTWNTQHYTGSSSFNAVAYGNNTWVALTQGHLYRSDLLVGYNQPIDPNLSIVGWTQ
jgi:hypothetical protein